MAEEAGVDGDGHSNQSWWRAPDVWLKAAASTTTALGLVTYAVLRVDYALFYDRFGLKPEDVGLGQAELISQSLAGVVLILIVIFVELVIFAAVLGIWGVLVRAMGKQFLDGHAATESSPRSCWPRSWSGGPRPGDRCDDRRTVGDVGGRSGRAVVAGVGSSAR